MQAGEVSDAGVRAPQSGIALAQEETPMFQKLFWGSATLLFALLLVRQTVAQLPGSLPGTFAYIPRADVAKVQAAIQNGLPNDSPVRMVDVGGKYNIGIYTLNYSEPSKPRPADAPVNGWYHRDIAEVYYFASGAGTWRVGGELENAAEDDPSGRSVREVRGPGVIGILKGYTDQKFSAGDIIIVPPGVPHTPGVITEPTKIIRVVIDPHRVMPLFPATTQTSAPSPAHAPAGKPAASLPGTFTYIPKADVDRVLKEEETPGPSGDRPVRTVDLPNINWRLGVYVLHSPEMPKTPGGPATSGWYHTHIAEIYYFMQGAGTFMIGGSLDNPTADAPDSYSTRMVRGPSVSGVFKGATNLKFEAGDLLIAPVGVPHTPSQITAVPRDILRIAIDPDKVLPLK
jgi:mannose-6-phosphate isomerase-like protein (cupin superfamily)